MMEEALQRKKEEDEPAVTLPTEAPLPDDVPSSDETSGGESTVSDSDEGGPWRFAGAAREAQWFRLPQAKVIHLVNEADINGMLIPYCRSEPFKAKPAESGADPTAQIAPICELCMQKISGAVRADILAELQGSGDSDMS